jgi:ribosomal 50S subunit-recycling heat shock protein
MRIDKFLKSSQLIKRRTVAKQVADGGRVFINDKKAKPGDEIRVGDVIRLELGRRFVQARVLSTNDKPIKGAFAAMYELLEEARHE